MADNLKIEYISINELKEYTGNAKLHPQEQIEQIKESMKRFSFNDPIAVWHDNEIIEGHGRLLAAQELGIDTVPIIRLDHLTDEERRAYMLVHNQLTMNSGFDTELLNIELESIDIDMEPYGFDAEIQEIEENQQEANYSETISVVIDCENETEAEEIYNDLTERGYKCRISTL
jgi:ParB-like chromosome segregation protein Spo0J